MKKLWIAISVGVLLGAGLTEAFHRFMDRRSRERFEMNLRCKQLADDFVKRGTSDYHDVMLNEVRFSSSRNQCVASIDEVSRTPPLSDEWRYIVVDVLSGEILFSDICSEGKSAPLYCGAGRNIDITSKRDTAFRNAVN